MQIWYIHGAGASERSFNWLCEKLPAHVAKFTAYSANEPISNVINKLYKQLSEPTVLVGHSLGGIVAVACASHPAVQKLVTISAPFGGVKHADFMAMFSREPLFHDLREHGSMLTAVRNAVIMKPHLAIVGTSGLPIIPESNDGVLTVASQMALDGAKYEMLPLNHFEVLLSQEVVELITSFVQDLK